MVTDVEPVPVHHKMTKLTPTATSNTINFRIAYYSHVPISIYKFLQMFIATRSVPKIPTGPIQALQMQHRSRTGLKGIYGNASYNGSGQQGNRADPGCEERGILSNFKTFTVNLKDFFANNGGGEGAACVPWIRA
jgi:hypothetical protein